jgi:hypothetical protein
MSSNFCLIAQLLQLRPDLLGAYLAWIDRYQHMLRGRTGLYLLDAGKAPKRIADTLLTTGTMHLVFTRHSPPVTMNSSVCAMRCPSFRR